MKVDENIYAALKLIRVTKEKCLPFLDLSGQKLKRIPDELYALTHLIELYLSNNELSYISEEISKLKDLQILDISNNNFHDIPPYIGNLRSLLLLNVEFNKIKVLPKELTNLNIDFTLSRSNELESGIFLFDNPIEFPPIEIIMDNDIRRYFENSNDDELVSASEAKLIIVGQGNVGKSMLLQRLKYGEVDESTLRTEGIDVEVWYPNNGLRVNFWDFGGQEIYHSVHQFFMSKRSLYLLVWEGRNDPDLFLFEYWLNKIKLLAGESPIFIVQNKIDQYKKLINQENFVNQFPKIRDYFDVSALTGIGSEYLKTRCIEEISLLPHIGNKLPKKWFDLRRTLENLNKNFIDINEYQNICLKFNIDDTSIISSYFHIIGVFLHFTENHLLKDIIFIRPEWATEAVYKIHQSDLILSNKGKFKLSELSEIWSDVQRYPQEIHMHLVELMKNFELCFEILDSGIFIIPEFLPTKSSEFNWPYANSTLFIYEFKFMPPGIIPRLIVIMNQYISQEVNYYKDGLIVEHFSSFALIQRIDNKTIEIKLSGPNRKSLLELIRRHVDYILSKYENLELKELVSCICDHCMNFNQPHQFNYINLIDAAKTEKEIQCYKSYLKVPIDALFDSIQNRLHHYWQEKQPQILKLFLASSGELKEEREKIRKHISNRNVGLHRENISLNLTLWEDKKHSFTGDRIQDYFNSLLKECDIVICVFFKKVGEFTREEFEKARQEISSRKTVKYLYVYFKSDSISMDEVDEETLEIPRLKKYIESIGQIHNSYKNTEDLILQLDYQLELIKTELFYQKRIYASLKED